MPVPAWRCGWAPTARRTSSRSWRVSGIVPPEAEQPDWSRLAAAVQGHFGEDDLSRPPDVIAPLEESLGKAGVTVEFFTYPTAGPRFFEEDGDAARQAWIRTLEFLRKHLG